MAAEYGHEMVPLDPGQMRAATADRERAIDVLKAAFAEGRLDQDEYTDRVGQVYSSRTYAELARLTADLPAGPLGALGPPPQPVTQVPYQQPSRPLARRGLRSPALVVILLLVATGSLRGGPDAAVVILPVIAVFIALSVLLRLGRR
jgi:Domain of unknown function (DUF1707)